MANNYAEPPDGIKCVNCGDEIEPYFIEESQSGGWWVHSKNGDGRCGRPEKEWGFV